jgi:tetratricopeptide (TPR) repeat protein
MTPPTPAILALVSAPLVDLSGEPVPLLKADRELADLESWLCETGRTVELTVEWAETERLQRALLRRRFDVLHYTGHGSQEALAFEDGRGGLHALTADQLAALVCPSGELAFRLAFLSACHSGKLAAALLDAGVPHVVAVDPEEPVTDQAAAAFARAFYAAMLAGQNVISAFAQGRTSVYTDPNLDRIGRERSISDLAEREARKFRLLPTREEGGDHSAPLFSADLPTGKVARYDPPSTPHRLGARPETFTGRQRELHQLVGHLLDNRLTILTGMGGMGKTELAREAGRWLAARGGHFASIHWADLREVTGLALIRARLAEAAGLTPEAARDDETLAAALSGADRLLVLDDLDQAVRHDLAGLRRLLEAIYSAGGPHLLLTTRERLGRRPPAQYQSLSRLVPDEAAHLFLDLARRYQPALSGDPADLDAVLRFLGGWPLALVLAAPLLADYSLAELYRRLEVEKDQLLADPTLPPEARDKLDSVDVSLSLSYAHLEQAYPEAARVFPLLALFPGGADEVAIRAVLGPEALDAVARLRAASLLEEAGDTRVRLPGPAHAYAERRLPPDAGDQYGPPGVAYYLALIESVGEVPLSHESGLSLAVTLNELPNLHAFADWGLAQEGETAAQAARLVGSLRNLYMLLAWPEEGTARLRRAVEAAQRAGDRLGEANTRKAIGDVQRFQDENDAALQSYAQALDLFRQVGDRLGEANTRKAIGDVQRFQDENDAALQSYAQALDLFRQVGDRLGEANTLQAIGDVQRFQDENDAALQSYAQALDLFRQVGDRLGEANTRKATGDVQRFQDENDAALQSYAQALDLFRQVGDRLGEANTLLALAPFSENAEEVFGIALSLYEAIGDQYSSARGLYYYAQFLIAQGQTDKAIAALEQCRDKFLAIHLTDLAAAAQRAINQLSGQ